jgi:hypothetical protein
MSFFVKFNFAAVLALVFAFQALAAPTAAPAPHHDGDADRRELATRGNSFSFDNWREISSLDHFDDFYGNNRFNSRDNEVIVVEEVRCNSRDIRNSQQQLAIVLEVAKQIILEQSCDVETRVLLLNQHRSGFSDFYSDVSHRSGRDVGFDSDIARLIEQLIVDGQLNSDHDFGFSGSDVGHKFSRDSGSNWDDSRSPNNLRDLDDAIRAALEGTSSQVIL